MVVFNPVVQQSAHASDQMDQILKYLLNEDCYGVILRPNSDAGGEQIDRVLDDFLSVAKIDKRFCVL